MIERVIIENIFCNKIEHVGDLSKVVSYISFCDPVINIRYNRIILRDSYDYCLIEIQVINKGYINFQIAKNGIAVELSLINYDFKFVNSKLMYHKNNYIDGVPYFNFTKINKKGITHYMLNNCSIEYLKFKNCLAIKIVECELKSLYWVKTDNIFYGLRYNILNAVVYDIPENEEHIFRLF